MIYIVWFLSILIVVCWLKFRQRRRIQELTDLIDQLYQQDYQIPMKQDDFSQLEDHIYKLFIELVEEKEKVHQLSQDQSQNIEDIAHQIKTPLTGMLFALENDKTDPATFSQQLNRLNDLSNALLKLASLDANVDDLNLRPVSLREVTDYALDIFSDDIEDRGIKVDNRLGDQVLMGHFNWLSEAVINILKNAINQEQTTHIYLEMRENPIYLEVSIRDDGGGIAKEKQKKIFQRFYKDPDSKGFGIGLSMAKRIVEKHQGQISCRNTEQGAEFILQFYK
ncbi:MULTISPECIES: sensor histidine kinase [Aerococcus]|uniref:sensor histidine kinase n=1 Tax=Aerococcus urinae (strain CCUG 59500 / ACS-120-V-Col10a) TaxID=2976812 RepID=UPI0005A0A054|nr:HAMP domain-containing sensor histidine kinase [Aerococcus sp. Group 1]MCY3030355.1 HAMP domain-containing histidine kinase [Aerococcus sp. Group 1]MCY3055452.1 HAMP domain-containing histidine kinase [Aerococcus sp. Group 1]MCY3057182.1 HAMP domain-containing histidine kinase [Aerococcus sp. Group 1]MCY3061795.1 HAMP domain-containing histidine kinase [Aerococcus sp. Group 1]